MKKLFIKTFTVLIAMSMVMACTDFLDQPSPGKVGDETYYNTDRDAEYATIAIYDKLSQIYNGTWQSLYLMKTIPSDESNTGGSGPSDQSGYQEMNNFSYSGRNGFVVAIWQNLYNGIHRANQVINLVEPSNDLRNRLIGEAKVLRAYFYMELVSLWGDVPLMLGGENIAEVKRAPKAEVYAQIEKDLTEAIQILPKKAMGSKDFRVDQGAAQGLLGKAHLYQEEWSDALLQFETVINSGSYGLENSIGKVFSKAGEFGKESLFEVSLSDNNKSTGSNHWDANHLENNIIIQLMGPRSYPTKIPGDSLNEGWGFNTPTEKMYNAFIAASDNSLRRAETIMSKEDAEALGGFFPGTGYGEEGYIRRKYGTYANETTEVESALNYGTNFRILRYADVLLMAAEAAFRVGQEEDAKDYLNEVRQRPGTNLPNVTATGAALFEAIVTERQLELAFEGHRFVDLIRWNRAAEVLGTYGFVAGTHEVFPIPTNDVLSAGLTPNPGY